MPRAPVTRRENGKGGRGRGGEITGEEARARGKRWGVGGVSERRSAHMRQKRSRVDAEGQIRIVRETVESRRIFLSVYRFPCMPGALECVVCECCKYFIYLCIQFAYDDNEHVTFLVHT